MRHAVLLLAVSPALTMAGCATTRVPESAASTGACPYRVLASVSNPGPYRYDIYFQEPGKVATAIGEVLPGGNTTVSVPGAGMGRVFLQRPQGDQQYTAYNGRPLPETRLRVHCSGG